MPVTHEKTNTISSVTTNACVIVTSCVEIRRRKRGREERSEWLTLSGRLDLRKALLELRPVLHNDLGPEIHEVLSHLKTLVVGVIAANVTNDGNAGTDGTESTRLAVLDGNSLIGRLTADLEGVEVDGGVRLGGRLGKRAGSTEDKVGIDVFVLADFLDRSLDTTKGRRGDNRHVVLLGLVKLLQLFGGTNARLGLLIELENHLVLLAFDVFLQIVLGQLELVLGLERDHHTAEVLADEVLHEVRAGVAVGDTVLLEDFIGEIGTRLEGQLF